MDFNYGHFFSYTELFNHIFITSKIDRFGITTTFHQKNLESNHHFCVEKHLISGTIK